MFKGLGNIANLTQMLKQASELKEKMEELREQLAGEVVEATYGGMIKLAFNGKMDLLRLEIDPELLDPAKLEELEVMVRGAVNEGIRQTQEMVRSRMQELTGGMNLPGLT